MKKIMNRIFVALVCASFSYTNVGALGRSKISRFDFMIAIEEANVSSVTKCLAAGADLNTQWGDMRETPLMYAIRKLAAEKENQEKINRNFMYGALGGLGLYGLAYGYLHMKGDIKDYMSSFRKEWQTTVQNRLTETIGYPLGVLTGAAAAIFFTTTLVNNTKKIVEYLYFGWKKGAARLMIIEQLVKHPSLDLSVRNEGGHTALDIVRELLQKKGSGHNGYINNLLGTAEQLIRERMRQVAAAEASPLGVRRKR